MWPAILGVVAAALGLLTKLFGGAGDGKGDQRVLGRAEQQNADSKADIATIRVATEAARAAEDTGDDADDHDPNDRANRRR